MQDLKRLAELMDSKYKGPFGFRFGLDGLIGLLPVAGNVITSCVSFYIIIRAAALGCPPVLIVRMGLNVLIDNIFDWVPILGNLFDFIWRANSKNIILLEAYMANPGRAVTGSRWMVFTTIFVLIAILASFILGAFYFLHWLLTYI